MFQLFVSGVCLALLAVAATLNAHVASNGGGTAAPAVASAAVRTVWDGVYTADQAAKGSEVYRTICAECHSSGEAPAIVGRNFLRRWYDDNLNVPFAFMKRAMPDNAPGTLTAEQYLDVLSFMLEAGGFPAGHEPLTEDPAKLSAIMVVAKEEGQIPDGMMIQSVGCLANSGDTWTLTRGSMPMRARNPGDSPADALKAMAATPLGTETLQIPTMLPQRGTLAGHKVLAKGIFNVNPAGNRLNLTALQSLADRCTE